MSKGFEKVVGQKLSNVVPNRDMLMVAKGPSSSMSSPATKLFRLTPIQNAVQEASLQKALGRKSAPSHRSSHLTAKSKPNSGKSESSSSMMRWQSKSPRIMQKMVVSVD